MTSVCLFSSNIRPQYEQDIIDVAAAPAGHVVRFRYETRYVDDQIREAWSGNKLAGRDALVLYSIQQPQNYHPPAFIPVRHAIVASSTKEGSVCVIDFRLGGYAVLRDPAGADETRGAIVSDFDCAAVGRPRWASGARPPRQTVLRRRRECASGIHRRGP